MGTICILRALQLALHSNNAARRYGTKAAANISARRRETPDFSACLRRYDRLPVSFGICARLCVRMCLFVHVSATLSVCLGPDLRSLCICCIGRCVCARVRQNLASRQLLSYCSYQTARLPTDAKALIPNPYPLLLGAAKGMQCQ